MDYIEAAAIAVMLYELTEMTTPARELADVLVRSTESVAIAVGGPEERQAAAGDPRRLHRGEPPRERGRRDPPRTRSPTCSATPTDPLLVIKWKEVYEALENATDRCEDVANIIEGVVLEHA